MTLFEIIFLIMFAIFIVVMGVVAVAEMLTYARSKNLSKTIEVYQKNFEEINKVLENHKTGYEQLTAQVERLERRIEKLEPKPTAVADMYLKSTVYPTKEKVEEIVDYKVENAALKKENEKYKKLYNELIQEKIDKQNWEYLGDKK